MITLAIAGSGINQAGRMAERPADRCPYTRPFPDDFHGCPAYQPNRFVALDTGYRPMPPIWTCSHLDAAAVPQRTRFYAKCRIGNEAARAAWVASMRVDRLATIRALQDEMAPAFAELTTALWSAKANQLRSDNGSPEWREATARLHELGRHFMTTLEAMLEERAELYESLGFPLDACMRLFDDLVERWIAQPNTEVPEIPDSALEPFPPDTRVFLKPEYVDASGT